MLCRVRRQPDDIYGVASVLDSLSSLEVISLSSLLENIHLI